MSLLLPPAREPALFCARCRCEIYPGELYCELPEGPYCRTCLALLTAIAGD